MSDKESYETYEYLPDGNEVDQFFLVQDDGTFLSLNNRQVQYMTQGQDVKEVVSQVQPCAVYDVTSPQFLIDVNNSAEVISVPDQLMLPNGENIIISNNYLLPVPNTTEEQIVQQDEVMQYQEPDKHINAEEDNGTQKTTDNCTEITLSDEQFHVLEQKGWILLETNDKVYVLDTLGLHDITTNDRLIQKLKCSEGSSEYIQEETSLSSQQDEIRLDIGEDGVKLSEDIIEEHDPFLMDSSHNEHAESMEISSLDTNETLDTKVEMASIENNINITDNVIPQSNATESIFDTKQEENIFEEMENVNNENVDSKLKDDLKSSKTKNIMFKVNTNIAFKDIPNKIALGETKSGKKLFAKITNLNNIDLPKKQYSSRYVKRILRNKTDCNNTAKETKETKEKKLIDSVSVDEKVFEALIRQGAEGAEVRCSAQDISSAHTTLMQLLKIPDFNTLVFDRNLIITKVVSVQEEQGTYSSGGQPSLVTGRITSQSGRYCFLHVPDMLHNIINKTEDYKPDIKKGDTDAVNFDDNNVLHVHVNEMKRADNVLRVSITLNTRKIPIEATSDDNKRKFADKAFACRNCASIFNSEDDLKEHQQTQCLDVDGDLSIDLDKKVAGYTTVIENGKDKMYHCNQCRMQFVKLHNCLKHLKTHYNCETMDDTDSSKPARTQAGTQPGSVKGIHKCKMCPCTFNHQQTLVKHIVNKHINV